MFSEMPKNFSASFVRPFQGNDISLFFAFLRGSPCPGCRRDARAFRPAFSPLEDVRPSRPMSGICHKKRVLTVQIIKRIPVVQKVASESAFSQMHIQDAAGNAARTTPYYLDQARSGHIPKKLLGGLLAMAAIGSLIASPDLAQKLGIGGLFGVPAMSLLMEDTDRNRCIVHNTGEELPATLVNQSFKMPAKTAAVSFGTSILSAYWTSYSSTVADLLL